MQNEQDLRPEPFDKEKGRIARARERWIERTPPVEVKFPAASHAIRAPYNDDSGHLMRMGDTFGTRSGAFLAMRLTELSGAVRSSGRKDATEQELNAGIAFVAAVAPENEVEAALAVQMAGCHTLAADMIGRMAASDSIEAMQAYGNLAVKLQRTFAAQVEALARLRGKGQQTVRVEHVTVHPGGQAIVGDVHHHTRGEGASGGKAGQPHETDNRTAPAEAGTALLGQDAAGDGVPIGGHAERPLPAARRTVAGRAGGQ